MRVKGPYAGGVWKVHVEIPDGYPYKSPSIGTCATKRNGVRILARLIIAFVNSGFVNRVYHPNIDELYCHLLSDTTMLEVLKHFPCLSGLDLCVLMLSTRHGVRCMVGALYQCHVRLHCIERFHIVLELLNIFETFLPQLLLYPNPADPLNGEAAALLMNAPQEYEKKVKRASRT